MSSRPGRQQTTVAVQTTSVDGSERSAWGLRWVFPSPTGPLSNLAASKLTLGRGEDCEVELPGTETSRHHAEIVRQNGDLVIRDLGSTNGIYVNGRKVAQAPLVLGDLLRLGEWIAVVVELDRQSADPNPFRRMSPGLLVGPALGWVLEPAQRAAKSDLPVVVQGETGTGKECVARAIHDWSGRAGPFIGVNCAALPESLAEAELFGHRKGAFTGAEQANLGHFRAAEGGTLLLDEVTDLPLSLQAKLLRVLEQKEVMPLGESRPVPVDVRVIAAAQEPLDRAAAQERFRIDLYARLDGLTVVLPPLRERRDEVPFLFSEFLNEYSAGHTPAVEARLIEQLCLYDLPFNVRELNLLAKRLLVLHGHEATLRRDHLPERILAACASPSPSPVGQVVAVEQTASTAGSAPVAASDPQSEAEIVEQLLSALRQHRGVVARAAAAVGISRQRAYRLMEAYGGVDLDAIRGGKAD